MKQELTNVRTVKDQEIQSLKNELKEERKESKRSQCDLEAVIGILIGKG